MKTIHSISLAALLGAGSASAAVIGVNFIDGDWPEPTGINAGENTQALDNALSIVGATSWNNHAIKGAGASESGSILGIGMTLYRSNPYFAGSEGVAAGDASQQVFRTYLDDHESTNTYDQNDGIGASIHLTGLTTALGGKAYRVHVLLNTDNDNASLADVTLYDGEAVDPAATQITSLGVLGTATPTVLGNGTQPVPTGAQSNTQGIRGYVTFGGTNGFTANNIIIAGASSNGLARAPIAGFIIETVPEPSSTALLGLGGLALILRRRK